MNYSYQKYGGLGQSSSSARGSLSRYSLDAPLLFLISIILIVGLFVLYSASGELGLKNAWRQVFRIIFGLLIMWVIALAPPTSLKRWAPPLFFFALFMLVLVPIIGIEAKGARRWLGYGSFRFQPSEMMKLALPMAVAWVLSDAKLPLSFLRLIIGLVVIGVPTLLIAMQPDLGTAVLVAMSGLIMLFLAGLQWKLIITALSLFIGFAWWVWSYDSDHKFLTEYQRSRIETVLFPSQKEVKKTLWQPLQAKIAIGSGGLYGKGYLKGTQAGRGFLPEAHTDFIFALVCEEFGLAGALILLMLFLLVLFRCLLIATSAKDTFSRLLAGTLSMVFIIYVCINMLMVAGMLPVVGLPLPMISFGGTSIVSILASFGILMSVQTHKKLI